MTGKENRADIEFQGDRMFLDYCLQGIEVMVDDILSDGDKLAKVVGPMRQVIDGKLYDTQNGTRLYSRINNHPPSDFRYLWETLYRTAKNNYFLHCHGGVITTYQAQGGQSSSCGRQGIVPLTDTEAFQWLSDHAPAEVVDAEFPGRIEDA